MTAVRDAPRVRAQGELDMAKDRFEFARIASPEEVAAYLTALSTGLTKGDVRLEAGGQTRRLTPAGDLKIELRVKDRKDRGKIEIEIAWKQRGTAKPTDLRVEPAQLPAFPTRH